MVIFEGTISHKVFADRLSHDNHKNHNGILHGLSGICAGAMFAYMFMQLIVFLHGKRWEYINSPMGYWYLTEMIGFVIFPMILFFISYRKRNVMMIKVASVITMIGIIINRLNVTVIGFRWDAASHYYPSWMEIVVTLAVIFTEIWILRWIVTRMPVLNDPPDWAREGGH